jgi:hypothetical protein
VEDLDLIDGTPILDLKPFVPYADSAPEASSGWLPTAADPAPTWEVLLEARAEAQLAWLEARGDLQLRGRVMAALALGPAPLPYRRIREVPGGGSVLAVKTWRVRFRFEEARVIVQAVTSGYRPKELATGESVELDLHRAFVESFPS